MKKLLAILALAALTLSSAFGQNLPAPSFRQQINVAAQPGAVGDCVHDDTAAIQAAINAAIAADAELAWPPPKVGGCWNITSTISLGLNRPFTALHVSAQGLNVGDIKWNGGSGTTNSPAIVFSAYGSLGHSTVDSLKVQLNGSPHDVVMWDVDTTTTVGSSDYLTWNNCLAALGSGINNRGWRIGHNSLGGGDISGLTWNHSEVNASGKPAGTRGIVIEGNNSLVFKLDTFGAGGLEVGVTNESGPGAAAGSGGGALTSINASFSGNGTDYAMFGSVEVLILGGRYENGSIFFNNALVSQQSGAALALTVMNAEIDSYTSAQFVEIDVAGSVLWLNNNVFNLSFSRANPIELGGSSGSFGTFRMEGGSWGAGVDPLWRLTRGGSGATWAVTVRDVNIMSAGDIPNGVYTNYDGMVRPSGIGIAVTDGSGTPGAVTQNVLRGRAAVALSTATTVVTNSLVTSASQILLTTQGNDTTCKSMTATPAAGSFTARCNASATAATTFDYTVIQP